MWSIRQPDKSSTPIAIGIIKGKLAFRCILKALPVQFSQTSNPVNFANVEYGSLILGREFLRTPVNHGRVAGDCEMPIYAKKAVGTRLAEVCS